MTDLPFWSALAVVTVATSILSGILGMAGGMLLLTVLLLRLDPLVAIPVHGMVQLVANGSRAWFLRAHVQARPIWLFALPLLPAGALGLWVLGLLDPEIGRILIGAFVLGATWWPRTPKAADRSRAERWLPLGGALCGFGSTLVGATGPLFAPFILALELSPQSTVGTMAACQVFQHATKVLLFGVTGFDFQRYALPAIGLSACAILGSAVGTHWLDRVPREAFKRIVRAVLSLLALQLIVGVAWQLAR
jgi:uncharacterized membrane protein YfcA